MFGIIEQAVPEVVDAIDLLTKVDQFYHNAWLKLIFLVGVGGLIVGVVVPLVIQYIQRASFKSSEAQLRNEITEITSKLKAEIKQRSDDAKKRADDMTTDIDKAITNLKGQIEQGTVDAKEQADEIVTEMELRLRLRVGQGLGNVYGTIAEVIRIPFTGKNLPEIRFMLCAVSGAEHAWAGHDAGFEIAIRSLEEIKEPASAIQVAQSWMKFIEKQLDYINNQVDAWKWQAKYVARLQSLREKLHRMFTVKKSE